MIDTKLQKSKERKNMALTIIGAGGAIIVIGIVFFLLFMKPGGSINYSLIPVSTNDDRWGYINQKGEYVINPQFGDADFFNEDGLAKIKSSDGKTGYINKTGRYVIPANYKDGTAFNGGQAFVVMEGGFPTCINTKGEMQFELAVAKYVTAFCEGLAMFITEEGESGFVDTKGNIVINAQFEKTMPFCDGFARIWQKGEVGFVDKTGKIVINPQFLNVGNFSEGKAPFFNGSHWGYINPQGAYVINPQFDDARQFTNGVAAIKQGKAYGYINKEGKVVINAQFDQARTFSDGLAAVQAGAKCAYINEEGKYAINPQFEYAGDFYKGIAPVSSTGKWGFINRKGQYVINPQFKRVKYRPSIDEQTLVLVENDYYDTSELIRFFFDSTKPNSFNGFNNSSTLQNLLDNTAYGDNVFATNEHLAFFGNKQSISNDISITDVAFNFYNPIYSIADYGKQYHFDEKIHYIKYRLNIVGKTTKHTDAIIVALKNEIERKYAIEMRKEEAFHGYAYFYSGNDAKSGTDFFIAAGVGSCNIFIGFENGIDNSTPKSDIYKNELLQ